MGKIALILLAVFCMCMSGVDIGLAITNFMEGNYMRCGANLVIGIVFLYHTLSIFEAMRR